MREQGCFISNARAKSSRSADNRFKKPLEMSGLLLFRDHLNDASASCCAAAGLASFNLRVFCILRKHCLVLFFTLFAVLFGKLLAMRVHRGPIAK
jgi:hypothetical protein